MRGTHHFCMQAEDGASDWRENGSSRPSWVWMKKAAAAVLMEHPLRLHPCVHILTFGKGERSPQNAMAKELRMSHSIISPAYMILRIDEMGEKKYNKPAY